MNQRIADVKEIEAALAGMGSKDTDVAASAADFLRTNIALGREAERASDRRAAISWERDEQLRDLLNKLHAPLTKGNQILSSSERIQTLVMLPPASNHTRIVRQQTAAFFEKRRQERANAPSERGVLWMDVLVAFTALSVFLLCLAYFK